MNAAPHPVRPGSDPQPAPSQPSLALDELSDRCMGNAVIVSLILDKFEAQLRGDLREIERGLAAADAALLARTAHALKGAAGAVAAGPLRDLAAQIETWARRAQLEPIAECLVPLIAEADRCLACLPSARAALAGGPARAGEPGVDP